MAEASRVLIGLVCGLFILSVIPHSTAQEEINLDGLVLEFDNQFQKKVEKKMPMIKVPDLFKNVKIKKPNYLKYQRINLDKFSPPSSEGTIIPNHYVKHIDNCNSENQNTEECFIKHPTTWLNQRLYDEIEKPKIINTQNADFSIDAIINADDKNIDLFKNVNVPKCTLPNAIARLAINRIGSENSRPAPMYLQEPNADLPKEQPPKLI